MTPDPDPAIAALDLPAAGGALAPWFLVVARGHARLRAELEAIFHDHPKVRVIEDRREGQALLPCGEVTRAELPSA
jgi:hypothetical protein